MSSPHPCTTLLDHFAEIPDPRTARTPVHPLPTIIGIAILAVICGADTYNDIEDFGTGKDEWLATFLDLTAGVPSHDTFNRVFAAIDPVAFGAAFSHWTASLGHSLAGVVAIDGKTSRRSHGRGKHALHMVSAWSTEAQLVFGQVAIDQKSNEITAIPALLSQLDIEKATITIDAMGCQRDIAEQIVRQKGRYVLALKGNHGGLHDEVIDTFRVAQQEGYADITHDMSETVNGGHGRIEKREHTVITDTAILEHITREHPWPHLAAVGRVHSTRTQKDKTSSEDRYYLLSTSMSAHEFGASVREHWGIENRLHWSLDMTFREDECRKRAGHSAHNFSLLRRLCLNLIRQHPRKNLSLRSRRFSANTNPKYLLSLFDMPPA